MLSVSTISAGTGYQYLTAEVATGAEDYYVKGAAEIGERPGQWMGRGAELLDLSGTVRPEQMALMYGQGMHPQATVDDPRSLGAPFKNYKSIPERIADARVANPGVDAEEWERIEFRILRSGDRSAAAGYDLTFSPPKSWSVLWAAAPDEESRQQIWDAHHQGVRAAVGYLEREACFSRVGHDGVRQVDAEGYVAAAFDHRQSRNGDPQMHTHVAVLNRVRCTKDGQWRSLDGREVYAAAAAAGGIYDLVRESALEGSLGVVHEFRNPEDEVREIRGVSDEAIGMFSSRRRAVEGRLGPLLAEYEQAYGHPASPFVRARLSEWATLDTRPRKSHGETIGEALARWETQARNGGTASLDGSWASALDQRYRIGGADLSPAQVVIDADRRLRAEGPDRVPTVEALEAEVARTLLDARGVGRSQVHEHASAAVAQARRDGSLGAACPERLAEMALDRVAAKKATWTRNDLARQVERLVERSGTAGPEVLQARVDELVQLALRPGSGAVSLTAPEAVAPPPELVRASDGGNEHERHSAVRYATTRALLAEGRLVETARTQGAPVVPAEVVAAETAARGLGADQAAAAHQVLRSGRRLDVIVGPAGTGKTHTMAAVAASWQAGGGPVLGLALSQNAANVLGEAGGIRAENIAKWWQQNLMGREGWAPQPGLLVIIDEAGMVPTGQLDQVVGRTVAAGGKVLLIGDPEQLAAPGAGGAMRLIVADVGAARLDEVRRFNAPWEAQASLALRAGDPAALVEYDRRARIVGGTVEEMGHAAYQAWLADTLAGRSSLLMADTNEQAAELAGRARVDLVGAGRVEAAGVGLADANTAGVGDRIVTRRNDAQLVEAGRAVANRDEWVVEAVRADSSLRVRRVDDRTGVTVQSLPAGYVAEHVELAYASTVHGAQGRTVDTAHSLISERTGRAGVYVGMTRGREGNWAYVACDTHPAQDEPRVIGNPTASLIAAVTRDDPEAAATQVLRDEQERAESLRTLYPRWQDALDHHAQDRWEAAIAEVEDVGVAQRMREGPAWSALVARLETIEAAGLDTESELAGALGWREVGTAKDSAAVLHWRLEETMDRVDRLGDSTVPPLPATFIEATPPLTGPADELHMVHYARQLAERMDERAAALGDRMLDSPPRWLGPLGPVPQDPAARLEWAERAGTVAAYRELLGVEGDDPLGERPGPRLPDAGKRWDAATEALHGPPVAAESTPTAVLQAAVDRAVHLTADAPDIVVDQLRLAEQQLRDAETGRGLLKLTDRGLQQGEAATLDEDVLTARGEVAELEGRHDRRRAWLDEHGVELDAGAAAGAELARREQGRLTRPYANLDHDQLVAETVDAGEELAVLDDRIAERTAVIERWEEQAGHWDAEASTVRWERPAWQQVAQERDTEAAAAARLDELDRTLARTVLRGGPRGQQRTQLQGEAERLRGANPQLAVGVDRAAYWQHRTEAALAQDQTAEAKLRSSAGETRGDATRARAGLPRLADTRQTVADRLDELTNERRRRQTDHTQPDRQGLGRAPEEPVAATSRPAQPAQQQDLIDPRQPAPAALDLNRTQPPQR